MSPIISPGGSGGGTGAGVGARVLRSSDQSIPNATATAISFDTSTGAGGSFDTNGFFSGGSPTRLTVPAGLAGYYMVGGNLEFDQVAAGGDFAALLRLNATTDLYTPQGPHSIGANNTGLNPCGIRKLAVGDFIELRAYQDSGGALLVKNFTFAAVEIPVMFLIRLGV
jgi:hypothetical protein